LVEAIDGPCHDHVEPALGRIPAQGIKLGPLIPALGAGYAVIPVDLGDLDAHAGGKDRARPQADCEQLR
jgi:hypothetical protein